MGARKDGDENTQTKKKRAAHLSDANEIKVNKEEAGLPSNSMCSTDALYRPTTTYLVHQTHLQAVKFKPNKCQFTVSESHISATTKKSSQQNQLVQICHSSERAPDFFFFFLTIFFFLLGAASSSAPLASSISCRPLATSSSSSRFAFACTEDKEGGGKTRRRGINITSLHNRSSFRNGTPTTEKRTW